MTASTMSEIDDSERPIEADPEPEKTTESLIPRLRPPSTKRRGPVIAGGIVRFDLGANERR
jgi:hypothetical protein